MRRAFVIDQRRCIGCHACTVACKEEHNVPLGAFRTWVKYVEKGRWPETRRSFAVLRCNHCDDASCVTICPTRALYKRADGVVDFDRDACIGCKSCMQACPYDALYIDPATQTAAKCNFCAHRLEVGLEPACVIVCPERAIIAGDLDDPASEAARLVGREPVQVRKPEQGTKPKLYYVGADALALAPAMTQPAMQHLWQDPPAGEWAFLGMPGEPRPEPPARTVYDAPHARAPWGWMVSAYLWTKSIAAGAMLLPCLAAGIGIGQGQSVGGAVGAGIALVFLALTTLLLVGDLKRPERFWFLLARPNWSSWLVKGAWILMAFGAIATAWLAGAWFDLGWVSKALAWPGVVAAASAAGYSAFLFGQCEGRDFWQSPLLLVHLLVAAVMAGAAALLVAAAIWFPESATMPALQSALALSLAIHAAVMIGELYTPHANVDAAMAAREIRSGGLSALFWGGTVLAGTVIPLCLLALGAPLAIPAALFALLGLWLYEDAWIRAGQAPPLS